MDKICVIFLCAVCAFATTSAQRDNVAECPGEQRYTDCGSACTRTCDNPEPVCIEVCVPKCECPNATIFINPNSTTTAPMCRRLDECRDRGRGRCEYGRPLRDDDDMELFCGRGEDRQDCPEDSSCVIDEADAYAVCCRDAPEPPVDGATRMTSAVWILGLLFCLLK